MKYYLFMPNKLILSMIKTVTKLTLLFALCSLLFASYLEANVTGNCSNCHTMHNSQNGMGVVQTYTNGIITTGVSTPQNQLLIASCIACHAGSTGQTNSFGAPIVLHTTNPNGQGAGHTLAGGDFYWVATGLGATDSTGHNVSGLAAVDVDISNNIGKNPPGWDSNATSGFTFGQVAGGEANWSSQLSCDGTYGCHGQHSSTGITGAHHGNTGLTSNQCNVADTVGNSYRFLGGIKGLENVDWNWNETDATHNEYYGVDDTSNRDQLNSTYANKDTISFSCAECHGYFHSRIDDSTTAGSPWLRHPTDIALPASEEYQYYTTYSNEAPIARPTVPASSSPIVTPGTDIVMCLSCHRAHASPYFKMVRWDYKSWPGAGTGGCNPETGQHGCCNVCHTTKN
jgi:hypothetical protein